MTKIPAGATRIKVTDKSRNYLGRTCPVSVPVSPSAFQSVLVGATRGCRQGRAGDGRAVPCRFPSSDALSSIAGSVNSPALGAFFQRPRPWVSGRVQLERGQTSHRGTRTGTPIPTPPPPVPPPGAVRAPSPPWDWGLGGLGGVLHTRVWRWLGTEAKFLQESRFLWSPDRSSPSPRCPPRSGRGLRWGPRNPGWPPPAPSPAWRGGPGDCVVLSPQTRSLPQP